MPYPGGKHGPGHYLSAGGGGSFFSPPFVLYDQVLETRNNIVSNTFVLWKMGTNPGDGVLYWFGPGPGFEEPVATIPLQFWDGLPTPPLPPNGFAVRRSVDFGPDPIVLGDLASLGTWFPDGPRSALLGVPPNPGTAENTSTYEMALFADQSQKQRPRSAESSPFAPRHLLKSNKRTHPIIAKCDCR